MPIVPTKDRPLNMPCNDPESCKHFKAETELQERIKELEQIYLGQIRVIARTRITYKERVKRMAALAEQALKGK